jgi:hypothetical protein
MIDLSHIIRAAKESCEGFNEQREWLYHWYGDGDNARELFVERESLQVCGAKKGRIYGMVHLGRTFKGHWLMSTDCSTPDSGSYSQPSIFSRTGYDDRKEALFAGIAQCEAFFRDVQNSTNSCTSQATRNEAGRCLAQLAVAYRPKQMSFDL